jgi:uncharacterized YigZ family protein
MTAPGYPVPAAWRRSETVIERSRFIATLDRADTAAAARGFIDRIREEFPDATHNCWAYVAGPPGSTASIGMSDAGEPHGTAGRPMLDVLLHSGIGEIAAVVTRYYGGIKLGKGGLVRAYGGSVRDALAGLALAERVERRGAEVCAGYPDIDALRRALDEAGAEVLAEEYGEEVRYRLSVPAAGARSFEALLRDRTAGRARIRWDEAAP